MQSDPEYFYTNLPYAMVLGVTDVWSDKFDDLDTQPPSWWVGTSTYNTFSAV